MIRTALKPKWLALLGLVVTVVVLFGWLGLWQLNVARHKGQAEALQQVERQPEAPIDEVLTPQTSLAAEHVGRSVRATGRYDASRQVVVVDRRLGDRVGSWVLTPFVVDSSGADLAVVRGFVAQGAPVPAPPPGTLTLHANLQPQEGAPERPVAQPAGRVQSVDLASLVNVWGSDVYSAFALMEREDPPASGASSQVSPVPPPVIDVGGVNWRNAAYAVQWWVFAAFVVYLWWRMVRDDHHLDQSLAAADSRPEGNTGSASDVGDHADSPIPSSGGSPR